MKIAPPMLFPMLKVCFLTVFLAGCEGPYSTLAPAGPSAQVIAQLFWWMCGGALIIWLLFVTLFFYAIYRPHEHHSRTVAIYIIGGGVIFPLIVLCVLLYFSLKPLPELLRKAPPGSLQVEISGVQWWWRVRYRLDDGSMVELANEVRLPVNEEVQFHLSSEDVIHSFWIPSLGGKMDMIPGRKTMLTLRPTQIGTYGGVCAEYCGTSHSLMKFKVVVMEKKEFQQWLENQQSPVQQPVTEMAKKGERLFKANGCLACHTVRGIGEHGVLGPDLTHVGSRLSLGAGILPNSIQSFHSWISQTRQHKPGVKMPTFEMLPEEERKIIATWLAGLK